MLEGKKYLKTEQQLMIKVDLKKTIFIQAS